MKTSKLGTNKISRYYRVDSYYTSLERIAKVKGTTVYPYLSNNMAVNRTEGLKLCPVDSAEEITTDKVEAIKPIGEDDCYA